ncbi:hypothetical protein Shal_3370 [Shewanella halifaxensis HAW-EB4]|uniref:Uncharacterized protein n=1 Tax=Shewanella halifaxensis (strain HAW-EB4) TaxID=458817 RepID=B0TS04_SHEHH|nr:hypothetical protein Shal_3370 [Shewanella halifaxensis HAW-EB4]
MLSLMSACSQQVQEKELSERFMDNQSKFERLSNLSCTLLNNDFKAMQYTVGYYNNRESKAKINEKIKDYQFKWANLNKYGAQFENNLKEIDKLLVDLDVDGILRKDRTAISFVL